MADVRDITAGDIIRALEGPIAPVECVVKSILRNVAEPTTVLPAYYGAR